MTGEMFFLAALLLIPIVGVSFVALRRAWEPQERMMERLRQRGQEPLIPASSELIFEWLTPPLAGVIPIAEHTRDAIYQELRTAGYYRPGALTNYLALRNVLVLAPLLLAALVSCIVDAPAIPYIAVGGLLVAVLGFSLPRLYLQARGRTRSRQIERGLPTAVDLLTLALTAGLNLYAALQRVASELRFSYPVLAEELDLARRQSELSSLDHALTQLGDRVRLPEMRNLAIILSQSERGGTDATAVLLETSNAQRISLRQRAEAQANRTNFWMLFPTIGCFLIAAGIVLVGPAFLEFNRQITQNRELLEGKKTIQSLVEKAGVAPSQAAKSPEQTFRELMERRQIGPLVAPLTPAVPPQ